MSTTLWLVAGILAVVFGILVIFVILRWRAIRLKKNIPKEILDTFNEAERRFAQNGNQDPHQILWELRKFNSRSNYEQDTRKEFPVRNESSIIKSAVVQPGSSEIVTDNRTTEQSPQRETGQDSRRNKPTRNVFKPITFE